MSELFRISQDEITPPDDMAETIKWGMFSAVYEGLVDELDLDDPALVEHLKGDDTQSSAYTTTGGESEADADKDEIRTFIKDAVETYRAEAEEVPGAPPTPPPPTPPPPTPPTPPEVSPTSPEFGALTARGYVDLIGKAASDREKQHHVGSLVSQVTAWQKEGFRDDSLLPRYTELMDTLRELDRPLYDEVKEALRKATPKGPDRPTKYMDHPGEDPYRAGMGHGSVDKRKAAGFEEVLSAFRNRLQKGWGGRWLADDEERRTYLNGYLYQQTGNASAPLTSGYGLDLSSILQEFELWNGKPPEPTRLTIPRTVQEAGTLLAGQSIKKAKTPEDILKDYAKQSGVRDEAFMTGYWEALVDHSREFTIANTPEDPDAVEQTISELDGNIVPINTRAYFEDVRGVALTPEATVTQGRRPGNWVLSDTIGGRDYRWNIRQVSTPTGFELEAHNEALDVSGFVTDYYDLHPELTVAMPQDREYLRKRRGQFDYRDFVEMGEDIADYFNRLGEASRWSPEEIAKQTASYILENTRDFRDPEALRLLVSQQTPEVAELLRGFTPTMGSELWTLISGWLGVPTAPRRAPELEKVREVERAPGAEEIWEEIEEEVERKLTPEIQEDIKATIPRKQRRAFDQITEELMDGGNILVDIEPDVTMDELLSAISHLQDNYFPDQILFTMRHDLDPGVLPSPGYDWSFVERGYLEALKARFEGTDQLVHVRPEPETEASLQREAQEPYAHPYSGGFGRGDEISHQFFERGPIEPTPPEFPFRVGDEGTLEELTLPIISEYLTDIAEERYGIEDFLDIVNNQDKKVVKFIVSKTKPHSVWEDDSLLLVNLYLVHNIADLMSVLVHEFTHVMSVIAGLPMSAKEDRKDATPAEYVEFPEEQDAFLEYIQFRSFVLREPRDLIEEKLLEIVGPEQEEKIDEWLYLALGESVVTAGYPKHPDTIVVESEFYPRGLTEADVWSYYDGTKNEIVGELEGHNVMLVIKADGEIYKRHPDGKEAFIRIGSVEDFDRYNNGRTVEFHKVLGDQTSYGFVDVDPKEAVPFEKARKVAGDVYDLLLEQPDINRVDLAYSGGRGFHIYPYYERPKPTEEARKDLRSAMDGYIEQSGDEQLTTGITSEKNMIRLDTSTLKRAGSLRVFGSLNAKTGLRCTPIARDELPRFSKEAAKVQGKTASFLTEVERHALMSYPGSNEAFRSWQQRSVQGKVALPQTEEEFYEELVSVAAD